MSKVIQQLNTYLDGDDNVPDSIKSFASLHIHKEAVRILSLPRDMRAAQIERYWRPELLRAEVIRVFEYRKKG